MLNRFARPVVFATVALTLTFSGPRAIIAKSEPVKLTKLKDRPGKVLFKAAYGRGGRLGAFHDVDADGQLEFVLLDRDHGRLELSVLQLDSNDVSLTTDVGEGAAAGLVAANLDQDDALEYVVAYGERLEGFEKGLIVFASAIGGALIGFGQFSAGSSVALIPVVTPGAATDVYDIAAFDDDGTGLWHRNLRAAAAAGEPWKETRFQSAIPHAGGSGATILISDDARQELIGLSGRDGTTLWSRKLRGDTRASKRQFTELVDGDRLLPVLFSPGEMLILDPISGEPVLDGPVDRGVGALPGWNVFDTGAGKGFLVFGEDRTELRMVSLATGDTLWSHDSDEKVKELLPLQDGRRFIVVWKEGIRIFDASGEVLVDRPAPDKIKTTFSPVYRDLNGDGVMEFVFVAGKKIMCWNPDADEARWRTSLGSFVGGANPTQLYDAFYDIDGDGWLDVPVKKGSGSGWWLSGENGEVLASVGNGANMPVVGDWDGDGLPEIFWFKTWYEAEVNRRR